MIEVIIEVTYKVIIIVTDKIMFIVNVEIIVGVKVIIIDVEAMYKLSNSMLNVNL